MQRGPLSEGGALGALRPRSPEGRGHGPHSAGVPWRGPCSQLTHQQESRVALRPLALPSTPPRPPGCLGCHLLARPSLSTPGHRRELFRTADEWGCWAQARGAGSTDPEAAEPWTGLGREDEAREVGPSWGTPAAEAWQARCGGGASLLQLRGTRCPPRRPRASPQERSLHELPPPPARPAARGLRPPAVGAGEGQGGRPQAPRVRAVHRLPCSPPPRTRELGVCSRLHPTALPGPLPYACHDAGSRSRTRPALQLDGLPARAAWALSTAPGGGGHALLTADAQQ